MFKVFNTFVIYNKVFKTSFVVECCCLRLLSANSCHCDHVIVLVFFTFLKLYFCIFFSGTVGTVFIGKFSARS